MPPLIPPHLPSANAAEFCSSVSYEEGRKEGIVLGADDAGKNRFYVSRREFLKYSLAGTIAVWAGNSGNPGYRVSRSDLTNYLATPA